MTERFPYELRLPLAPYRFEWRDEAAVEAAKHATDLYSEERYTHADGSTTVVREYRSDGTFHIMSDRGEIELIDNAQDPYSPTRSASSASPEPSDLRYQAGRW